MASRKTGDWGGTLRALDRLGRNMSDAAKKALRAEAEILRGHIVDGITQQAPAGEAFQKLAQMTLASRRLDRFQGTKALIRTGALRNSIRVMETKGSFFIGVPRTAVSSDGTKLADVARIQELGAGPYVVRVTDKMRAYLAVLLTSMGKKPLKASTTYLTIRIPPRPFIGPVMQKYGKPSVLKPRLEERIRKLLKDSAGK